MKEPCKHAIGRSAGFLTCRVADCQSAAAASRNLYKTCTFVVQKGWGGVQLFQNWTKLNGNGSPLHKTCQRQGRVTASRFCVFVVQPRRPRYSPPLANQ